MTDRDLAPFAYSKVFEDPLDLHQAFFRDVSGDVAFARELFRRKSGREASSLIELQCGPAYYASTFARGPGRPRAVAVDTSARFLDFARALYAAEELNLTWVRQDPRALELEPADLVLLPLDSFAYLLSDEETLAFYASVERCLAPGGLLLIEANHPKDVGYIDYGKVFASALTAFLPRRVRAEWGINHPRFDLLTGLTATQIRITVEDAGRAPRVRVIDSLERVHFPRELVLVAERSGLRVTDFFGGYGFDPLSWEAAIQVFALKRAQEVRGKS